MGVPNVRFPTTRMESSLASASVTSFPRMTLELPVTVMFRPFVLVLFATILSVPVMVTFMPTTVLPKPEGMKMLSVALAKSLPT